MRRKLIKTRNTERPAETSSLADHTDQHWTAFSSVGGLRVIISLQGKMSIFGVIRVRANYIINSEKLLMTDTDD